MESKFLLGPTVLSNRSFQQFRNIPNLMNQKVWLKKIFGQKLKNQILSKCGGYCLRISIVLKENFSFSI